MEKVFLGKCKAKFELKKGNNTKEIEGIYERNLQNSRLKLVSFIFHFFHQMVALK